MLAMELYEEAVEMEAAEQALTARKREHAMKLKEWREIEGLTQKEVADLMGLKSVSHVSDIENGKRNLTTANAIKLC